MSDVIKMGFGPPEPPKGGVPPELARGGSRVWTEAKKMEKRLLGAYSGVIIARKTIYDRFRDLADQRYLYERAKSELGRTDDMVADSHRLGQEHDRGGRATSTVAYAIILVIASVFEWTVDRGSLLVLMLPLGMTEFLAAGLVVIKVLAAHWSGVIWRRRHHSTDPETQLGRPEIFVGWAALVGGSVLALAIAAVRGIYAGLLSGLLFAVAGLVLFIVMAFSSYMHANGAVDRQTRALWSFRRRRRVVRDSSDKLDEARAGFDIACRNLVRVCRDIVHRIDQIILGLYEEFARKNPDTPVPVFVEPEWLSDLRVIANGEIPVELLPELDTLDASTGQT